jgi:hypothetical protein
MRWPLLFFLAAGCATSGAEPQPEPPPPIVEAGAPEVAAPVSSEQACAENASGYCQRLQECFPFAIEQTWGDVARCAATVKVPCVEALRANGTGWTGEKLRACVKARDALPCSAFLQRKPELAECAITGSVDDGNACLHAAQCKSGHCRITPGKSCGFCVPRVPRGGACTGPWDCAGDLLCAPNGTCAPPESDDCDAARPCKLGTSCVKGKCKTPNGEGTECDPANGSAECDYYKEVYCNGASKKCTRYKKARSGESCAVPNEAVVCAAGSGCLEGKCAAPGGAGTLCDPSKGIVCEYPLSCASGTCRLLVAGDCN